MADAVAWTRSLRRPSVVAQKPAPRVARHRHAASTPVFEWTLNRLPEDADDKDGKTDVREEDPSASNHWEKLRAALSTSSNAVESVDRRLLCQTDGPNVSTVEPVPESADAVVPVVIRPVRVCQGYTLRLDMLEARQAISTAKEWRRQQRWVDTRRMADRARLCHDMLLLQRQ